MRAGRTGRTGDTKKAYADCPDEHYEGNTQRRRIRSLVKYDPNALE